MTDILPTNGSSYHNHCLIQRHLMHNFKICYRCRKWTKLLVQCHSFVTDGCTCSSSFSLKTWRARDDNRSEYCSSRDSIDRDQTTSDAGSFGRLSSSDIVRDLVSATLASLSESRSSLMARSRSLCLVWSSGKGELTPLVNCNNNNKLTNHSNSHV